MPIWAKNTLMRNKKMVVPQNAFREDSTELLQVEKNEDKAQLSISQLRVRRKRLEQVELIVPLAEADPKRKDVEVPLAS